MHHFAYIDPGTGALIWQSVIGIFVGIAFYLRRTRKWIVASITKIFRPGSIKQTVPETSVSLAKTEMEVDQM